jgi:hypothetical protein
MTVQQVLAGIGNAITTHLHIVFQVVGSTLPAAQEVSRVEGVVHVPANATGCARQVAHTKLLALQQCGVEVAQSKHYAPELSLRHKAMACSDVMQAEHCVLGFESPHLRLQLSPAELAKHSQLRLYQHTPKMGLITACDILCAFNSSARDVVPVPQTPSDTPALHSFPTSPH